MTLQQVSEYDVQGAQLNEIWDAGEDIDNPNSGAVAIIVSEH
jgi:hypothetical protein